MPFSRGPSQPRDRTPVSYITDILSHLSHQESPEPLAKPSKSQFPRTISHHPHLKPKDTEFSYSLENPTDGGAW